MKKILYSIFFIVLFYTLFLMHQVVSIYKKQIIIEAETLKQILYYSNLKTQQALEILENINNETFVL